MKEMYVIEALSVMSTYVVYFFVLEILFQYFYLLFMYYVYVFVYSVIYYFKTISSPAQPMTLACYKRNTKAFF